MIFRLPLHDRPATTPAARRRRVLIAFPGLVLMAAGLLWPGIFFLVQYQTGTRATATIDECKTFGAGRYARTHCTGSWVVGGSLLDGGQIVVGSISGADQSDVGKTIDVTVQ